jgi:hypothetical protein
MKNRPTAGDNLHATNLLKQPDQPNPWKPRAGADTLADERREVLDGIFESLRWGTGDPAARAACRVLLRHLSLTPMTEPHRV